MKAVQWFMMIVLFVSAPCPAQKQEEVEAAAAEKVTVEDVPQIEGEALKLFLEKIEVLGRLEKPQAVFIIPGGNPEIDDIQIKRSFFDDIFRPVEREVQLPAAASKPEKNRKDVIPW